MLVPESESRGKVSVHIAQGAAQQIAGLHDARTPFMTQVPPDAVGGSRARFRQILGANWERGTGWSDPPAPIFEEDRPWGRRLAWCSAAFIVFAIHAGVVLTLIRAPKSLAMDLPPPTAVLIDLEPISTANAAEVSQEARSRTASRLASLQVAEQTDEFKDATKSGATRATQEKTLIEKLPKGVGPAKLPAPSKKANKPSLSAKKQAAQKAGPLTQAKSKAPVAPPSPAEQPAQEAAKPSPTETAGSTATPVEIPSSWKTQLLAHLNRYKRYPEEAKGQHLQGTALLSFSLDRNGRVLNFFLARSSGDSTLDAEVLAMIERASPLPAPPPEVDDSNLHLLVPVQFSLR